MSMIKVLRQQKSELLSEGQGILTAAETAGRFFTDAELSRQGEIQSKITELNGQISTVEAQMDMLRQEGLRADPNAGAAGKPPGNAAGKPDQFRSLGEQLAAVRNAYLPENRSVDPRLGSGPSGLSEGVGSDGGFLVQEDFSGSLMQNIWTTGEVLSRVNLVPISANSNRIKALGIDETSRVNGSRGGGIQAFWTAEAGLKTATKPNFREINMELEKLTALCYVTDELLQDSTALTAWIGNAFRQEITFKVEDAIFNGIGAGMPLGFLNSGVTIVVPKETSQPSATINSANILNMWGRLIASSRKNAVWYINQDSEPMLSQLYQPIANRAGTENVGGIAMPYVSYVPPGVNGAVYGSLMGRPVIPVEYCSTLGTVGDIVLADPSQYLAINKGDVQADSSIHVRFIYDETVFRFVYRFNGQPMLASAITPYRGTKTISPFVALQTR